MKSKNVFFFFLLSLTLYHLKAASSDLLKLFSELLLIDENHWVCYTSDGVLVRVVSAYVATFRKTQKLF